MRLKKATKANAFLFPHNVLRQIRRHLTFILSACMLYHVFVDEGYVYRQRIEYSLYLLKLQFKCDIFILSRILRVSIL